MLGNLEIQEESIETLPEHGHISIAFDVRRMLEVLPLDNGLGGFLFREQALTRSKRKDYDLLNGGSPADWAKQFDVARWGLIVERSNGKRVGGAVIVSDTPDVSLLEGRRNLGLLWDLRVEPVLRGQGIGSALFRAAESWAINKQCKYLKVETQNTNFDACRFYARQGCLLGGVNCFAYPDFPDETQLLWYKHLKSPLMESNSPLFPDL